MDEKRLVNYLITQSIKYIGIGVLLILIAVAGSSMVFAQVLKRGEWIDLMQCQEIGNNNPICQNTALRAPKRRNIFRLESAIKTIEEKHITKKPHVCDVLPNTSVAILVPDVRYVGTTRDGYDKYCYPLDTDVIGIYKWSCLK